MWSTRLDEIKNFHDDLHPSAIGSYSAAILLTSNRLAFESASGTCSLTSSGSICAHLPAIRLRHCRYAGGLFVGNLEVVDGGR